MSRAVSFLTPRLVPTRPGLTARVRLFGLLSMVVAVFTGLQLIVQEGAPRIEVRVVPRDVPVDVTVPVYVERIVERVVYVPVPMASIAMMPQAVRDAVQGLRDGTIAARMGRPGTPGQPSLDGPAAALESIFGSATVSGPIANITVPGLGIIDIGGHGGRRGEASAVVTADRLSFEAGQVLLAPESSLAPSESLAQQAAAAAADSAIVSPASPTDTDTNDVLSNAAPDSDTSTSTAAGSTLGDPAQPQVTADGRGQRTDEHDNDNAGRRESNPAPAVSTAPQNLVTNPGPSATTPVAEPGRPVRSGVGPVVAKPIRPLPVGPAPVTSGPSLSPISGGSTAAAVEPATSPASTSAPSSGPTEEPIVVTPVPTKATPSRSEKPGSLAPASSEAPKPQTASSEPSKSQSDNGSNNPPASKARTSTSSSTSSEDSKPRTSNGSSSNSAQATRSGNSATTRAQSSKPAISVKESKPEPAKPAPPKPEPPKPAPPKPAPAQAAKSEPPKPPPPANTPRSSSGPKNGNGK